MKKIKLLVASLLLAVAFTNAQTPEAFNYQAVARSSAGTIINNQNISIQISVLNNGSAVYTETHAITTNQYGLFTLGIGQGNATLGNFSSIDWTTGNYSVQVEMDENGGSNYTLMGASPLLTVPYAMHAKTADNTFSGNYNDLTNTPAIPTNTSDLTNDSGFITNPDDADASATNELQNLSLSGTSLSISNGNSINLGSIDTDTHLTEAEVDAMVGNNGYLTSFTEVDGSTTNELQDLSLSGNTLSLSSDATPVNLSGYLDNTDNQTISLSGTNLSISNGNTINLSSIQDGYEANTDNQTISLSGTNLSITNGNTLDLSSVIPTYFDIIRDADNNTKVEVERIANNDEIMFTTGGKQMMMLNGRSLSFPAHSGSIFLGTNTGLNDNLNSNHKNIYIGDNAGKMNVTSQFNLAVGDAALMNSTGGSNVALGTYSLYANSTGNLNTAIGVYSMIDNTTGSNNVALGSSSMYSNTTGGDNVVLGNSAYYNNNGSYNTIIGSSAGLQSPTNSSGNVFIGYRAGYYETGSNKLIIGNNWNGTGSRLISGDFSTGKVTIDSVLKLEQLASPPSSPTQGEIYVGTDNHIYCYLGGLWKQLDN